MWVCPPNVLSLFLFWESFNFKNLEKWCWIAIFYAVIWSIWLARNDTVFNNKVWELEEVIDLAKTRMALWIKGKYNVKNYSVEDFKRCLEGIRRIKL